MAADDVLASLTDEQRFQLSRGQCPFCPKQYKHSTAVYKHIRVHGAPSVCGVCARTFASPDYLRRHMRTHEDSLVESQDKPKWTCPRCGVSLLPANKRFHPCTARNHRTCLMCHGKRRQLKTVRDWREHVASHQTSVVPRRALNSKVTVVEGCPMALAGKRHRCRPAPYTFHWTLPLSRTAGEVDQKHNESLRVGLSSDAAALELQFAGKRASTARMAALQKDLNTFVQTKHTQHKGKAHFSKYCLPPDTALPLTMTGPILSSDEHNQYTVEFYVNQQGRLVEEDEKQARRVTIDGSTSTGGGCNHSSRPSAVLRADGCLYTPEDTGLAHGQEITLNYQPDYFFGLLAGRVYNPHREADQEAWTEAVRMCEHYDDATLTQKFRTLH